MGSDPGLNEVEMHLAQAYTRAQSMSPRGHLLAALDKLHEGGHKPLVAFLADEFDKDPAEIERQARDFEIEAPEDAHVENGSEGSPATPTRRFQPS